MSEKSAIYHTVLFQKCFTFFERHEVNKKPFSQKPQKCSKSYGDFNALTFLNTCNLGGCKTQNDSLHPRLLLLYLQVVDVMRFAIPSLFPESSEEVFEAEKCRAFPHRRILAGDFYMRVCVA